MMVIGITGGVASGKSMVAQPTGTRGAAVLDADRLGHEVLRLPEVMAGCWTRWGPEVFGRAGRCQDRRAVDRAAIARRVFAPAPDGPGELEYLEN